MAELTFVGAAGTVTGSKHLITTAGKHIFVDCGLFQGTADVTALNNVPLPVDPKDVAAIVVTHGHIDHIGYLPKIVKDGFSGPVYCTPPTQALADIVLGDAAHLQQHLGSRGFGNERPHAPPPFYGPDDVAHALKLMQPFALNAAFDVAGVITATYHNAAHILGSAFVVLELEGKKLLCSGDIGRYGRPLLYDPEPIGSGIDAIVCESTYAGQLHPPQPLEALRDALLAGQARGGAIVIPAFAVERTQDILLAIGQIQQMEPKLAKLPIYLDSPMAEKVDALFADFPDAHKPIPNDTNNSFGCNNLTMAVSTDDSKALNVLQGPRVVISSSGMAAGGRVLHHLHNNLPSADATIIFVGYQSPGTLGFVLMHGATTVKIFGDTLPVRASLTDLQGYSAHADDTDFKTWFDTCTSKPYLYAVHGEVDSAAALVSMVESKYGWQAEPGERGTTVTI